MDKISDYILKAGTIDRRWIFLIIGLAVLLPLFFPLVFYFFDNGKYINIINHI